MGDPRERVEKVSAGERCFCGCGQLAGHDHHVIYQQELRWHAERRHSGLKLSKLRVDRRNIVRVAFACHHAHHRGVRERDKYELVRLPDSVYEFARELLGPGAAYEYLRRRYRGEDERLEVLLIAAGPALQMDPGPA